MKASNSGMVQAQLKMADERPGEDKLDGPVAEHLIRDAELAAGAYDVSGTALTVRIPALRIPTLAQLRAASAYRTAAARSPNLRHRDLRAAAQYSLHSPGGASVGADLQHHLDPDRWRAEPTSRRRRCPLSDGSSSRCCRRLR